MKTMSQPDEASIANSFAVARPKPLAMTMAQDKEKTTVVQRIFFTFFLSVSLVHIPQKLIRNAERTVHSTTSR